MRLDSGCPRDRELGRKKDADAGRQVKEGPVRMNVVVLGIGGYACTDYVKEKAV